MGAAAAEHVETDWSRDYTAFMRCNLGSPWMPEAEAQVATWLREKDHDVDLNDNQDYVRGNSTLSVRRLPDSADLRVSLVEGDEKTGRWITELIVHDQADGHGWVHLVVRNDQGRFVKVPRLARYLMQVLPLGDGNAVFADEPQILRGSDVDDLVTLLADEDRHALVFVAGADVESDLPFDPYVRKVRTWLREVYGLGQVIVLDPAATRAFANRVGERYAAPAWSIRTYHPGVDFVDQTAARRHRILGPRRLGTQSDGHICRLLGDVARQHAASRVVDQAVRRVQRRFHRFENRRLVEALEVREVTPPTIPPPRPEPEPVAPPEPPEYEPTVVDPAEHQLALVRRILGITEVTESALGEAIQQRLQAERLPIEALQRRVDELQTMVERLEDQNERVLADLEEAQEDTELARLEIDDRDGRIRWFESRLKEKWDYAAVQSATPSEFIQGRPNDFYELLEWIDTLEQVCFTGDRSEVAKLDQIDTNDTALRNAWDAVHALCDYVRARSVGDCEGGLIQYMSHPPSKYRRVPPKKWGAGETARTMSAYGSERVFPVPETIDSSGRAEMKAHFKLGRIGMQSPRMYILDGHPTEPRVFIGYIGAHLTNTHTN